LFHISLEHISDEELMKKSWLFLLLVAGSLMSLQAGELEKKFDKAISLWNKGDSAKAFSLMEGLAYKSWPKAIGPKAAVTYAEWSMRLQKNDIADDFIQRFLEYYPQHKYRERVLFMQALRRSEKGEFFQAAEGFSQILHTTQNPVQYARARTALLQLVNSGVFNASEKASLLKIASVDNEVVGILLWDLAREALAQKRYRLARYYAMRLIAEEAAPRYRESAQQLLASAQGASDGRATILVMAPLTGEYQDFGAALMQGVVLAMDQNPANSEKYDLAFIDTEGNAVQAVKKVRDRMEKDSVVAIVGPVLSAPSSAVGAWLAAEFPAVPMITPTATDEGIATLGKNIFQLNVPTGELARGIARYSMKCLDLREFGIFRPNTDYGLIMAEAFRDEVWKQGGRILAEEVYEEGAEDFQTQFNLLRSRRYDQLHMRRRIRFGNKDIHANNPGRKRRFMADSVFTFPGFFIPASIPEDAGQLAGHFTYNKLDGVLLGSSGWYGRKTLQSGGQSVQGSYFSTPFMENSAREQWIAFRKDFVARWNTYPEQNRVSGLSYDATKMILKALFSPSGVLNYLSSGNRHAGVYGDIQLDPEFGNNRSLHVVSVQQGKFQLSDQCPSDSVEVEPGARQQK
jgi:ABC-type branched-subunit amino acid transport system substrate-binding protein